MKIFLLSFLMSANAFAAVCELDTNYGEVTKSELKKLVDTKTAFVVDVNSKQSYDTNHVPTAIHYGSQTDFAKVLPQDKNALIVAYCGGTMCSAWKKAAMEACKLGYTNVKHFKEGIRGWVSKS